MEWYENEDLERDFHRVFESHLDEGGFDQEGFEEEMARCLMKHELHTSKDHWNELMSEITDAAKEEMEELCNPINF